jgi:hypothetical protein
MRVWVSVGRGKGSKGYKGSPRVTVYYALAGSSSNCNYLNDYSTSIYLQLTSLQLHKNTNIHCKKRSQTTLHVVVLVLVFLHRHPPRHPPTSWSSSYVVVAILCCGRPTCGPVVVVVTFPLSPSVYTTLI